MKLRMYQPHELQEYKDSFRCFFKDKYIYIINIKTGNGYKFEDGDPILINLNSRPFQITKEAVGLWKAGMWQVATLFDVHNACMIVRLNGEPLNYDSVEKYL